MVAKNQIHLVIPKERDIRIPSSSYIGKNQAPLKTN